MEFFRNDSVLAVVLISDENECSDGSCLPSQPTSRPDFLLDLVDQIFGVEKEFVFHSIIVPQDVSTGPCSRPGVLHEVATYGEQYKLLSDATQGIVGNICEEDYTSQLQEIGEATEILTRQVTLDCQPQALSHQSSPQIEVLLDGETLDIEYTLSGKQVTFSRALSSQRHEIIYHCQQDSDT